MQENFSKVIFFRVGAANLVNLPLVGRVINYQFSNGTDTSKKKIMKKNFVKQSRINDISM